jgi:hypothetical protein
MEENVRACILFLSSFLNRLILSYVEYSVLLSHIQGIINGSNMLSFHYQAKYISFRFRLFCSSFIEVRLHILHVKCINCRFYHLIYHRFVHRNISIYKFPDDIKSFWTKVPELSHDKLKYSISFRWLFFFFFGILFTLLFYTSFIGRVIWILGRFLSCLILF